MMRILSKMLLKIAFAKAFKVHGTKPIGNKHLLHECVVVVVIAYKTENTFSLWTRNFQCECTMEWKVGRKME